MSLKHDSLKLAIDDLEVVMTQSNMTRTRVNKESVGREVALIRVAIETLIDQSRALDTLPKIIEVAKSHGWNGVGNSKLLDVFLGTELEKSTRVSSLVTDVRNDLSEIIDNAEFKETPSRPTLERVRRALLSIDEVLSIPAGHPSGPKDPGDIGARLSALAQEIAEIGTSLEKKKAPKP